MCSRHTHCLAVMSSGKRGENYEWAGGGSWNFLGGGGGGGLPPHWVELTLKPHDLYDTLIFAAEQVVGNSTPGPSSAVLSC